MTLPVPTKNVVQYIRKNGKFLGSGCFRTVYRTQRGKWVLKVDHDSVSGYGNADEYAAYETVRKSLPDGVRVPAMYMFGKYLLAEYIESTEQLSRCVSFACDYDCERYKYDDDGNRGECWIAKLKSKGVKVRDIHYDNVRVRDGIYYIIDIGFGLE